MGRYVYLCFVKWTERGVEKDMGYWQETWLPKHEKLCEEYNVKLLKMGIPFGTVEEALYIYETDLPLAEFQNFRNALTQIGNERLVAYTKTTIVNCAF